MSGADIRMTPGNRDPARYGKASVLSAGVLALVMAGAPAHDILTKFLYEKEGSRLTAYPDGEGVWTICGGLTRYQGEPVHRGMKLSVAECEAADREAFALALAQAERIIGPAMWATLSEGAKAALASMVHNLGPQRFAASTAVRELRAGHRNAGCAAITLWIFDRKRDCRKAGSNCQGQPIRRMQEDELCLTEQVQ